MITSFHWINTGYTTGIERIAKGHGSFRKVVFPAHVGLLKDDQLGYILFDTGYGSNFNTATKRFPFKIYRWITPVYYKEETGIVAQLKKLGIDKGEIKYIILSHLHADHIGGLKEFPDAKIICSGKSLEILSNDNFKLLRNGVLPDLIPQDLKERTEFIEDAERIYLAPFKNSWTLFDGLFRVVDLPGHAKGQFGIIFNFQGRDIFLIADATWFTSTISNRILPSSIISLIVDNWDEYCHTIESLHHYKFANPDVLMIPSHCTENNYPFQID